ncbi:uncharacterized protein KY384_004374 [Bacidia gigantensis]|uniref:uncharacterized protein n=1 Tax=Bacidia gigantensis TaxID=2732470 RepID=UPI001D046DC3|nr:uncharacterized protein KY384_004374 [Bacidia gigantensis]KAG8531017.1 hypothetical protein KY384_004374 [Bacidia gigantensis]
MAHQNDEVQTLIRDLRDAHGDYAYDETEQRNTVFRRSSPILRDTNASFSHLRKPRAPDNYMPLPVYRPLHDNTANFDSYKDNEAAALDEYGLSPTYHAHQSKSALDLNLLAEPLYPPHRQSLDGSTKGAIGRFSLQRHTAPSRSPNSILPQRLPRPMNKGSIRPHQTPSKRDLMSSPSPNAPISSPTIGVKQRLRLQTDSQQPRNRYTRSQVTPNGPNLAAPVDFLDTNSPRQHHRQRSFYANNDTSSPSESFGMQDTRKHAPDAPPRVQGIQLISPNELPDRFRSIFKYPMFNAIQSKCFATAYQSNDNLIVSAPTGGGKTAILELAICQLLQQLKAEDFKVVYMAPTKSLCSERQREWHTKFAMLDLHCAELTGDTDNYHLRSVQSAHIIVTTPEKWDSMTRKWKDHARLMQMVRLFLIDEVHILREARGATLEAVVSRMKSVGSKVRFVALSATIPNSDDIASWFGKDAAHEHTPAAREVFGENFRPVKLQKYVVGLSYIGNDFAFEKLCDPA